jgi:F-type H+-transporting ATPase subunit b
MQIDWWTLAIQAVNFLILVWLLWRFLFRPVKAVVEKRRQLTEQAFADAETRGQEVDLARQGVEADRSTLAQEHQDMLKTLHEELEVERREILQQAKREADKLLDAARATLAEERQAALQEVQGQVAALAVELAGNLLGQASTDGAAGVFLTHLDRQLTALPADDLERLRKDLEADGARLTVVTAAPLTPQEREEWEHHLGSRLGLVDKMDFATDAEILGGAELRFPHAVLKFTWADQLNRAEELLRSDDAAS